LRGVVIGADHSTGYAKTKFPVTGFRFAIRAARNLEVKKECFPIQVYLGYQDGSDSKMPLLIDGHNLIGALPNISLTDLDDEAKLVSLLSRYLVQARKRAFVYFDRGSFISDQTDRGPYLSVIFIAQPRTADQAIRAHLERLGKEAANWTVISSDREIQHAAKQAGARVLSSQEFSRFLLSIDVASNGDEKPTSPLSEEELGAWMDLFDSDGS
jgi:predicted RNA-binding protein with PIN domain